MKRTTYTGASTNEISFPLGGIGTGSIGLAGNGRLIDWEIFNNANKGSDNGCTHFAVKAERGGRLIDARVLNGDILSGLTGQHGKNFGYGPANSTMAGFPHFRDCVFHGEFPIAEIDFADESFPGGASLTAFNPLIPLNEADSGIPAAFFEIAITNTTDEPITYSAAATLRNPCDRSRNRYIGGDVSALLLSRDGTEPDSFDRCDLTLATDETDNVSYQEYWYRGGWWDHLETYWRNFTENQTLSNRGYDNTGNYDHATLCVKKSAEPNETVTFRYVISWSCPNRRNYWDRYTVKNAAGEDVEVPMKNYYGTVFADSLASAKYSLHSWERLYRDTLRYHDELFASTLPEEIIEAVSATVSVLKTETSLRIGEKGDFYGWEGLNEHNGSCEGSCTHVWNYAYAMPFLFPALERNVRENDFNYNQADTGGMNFRCRIPFGREGENIHQRFRACVDGQMGGVMKAYRDWKISGDDEWLRSIWQRVKKSLEYAWSDLNPDRWDRDRDGVLEGRQHHTLDMELFGPSSWLEGFYLGALKAGAEMARHLGEEESAAEYEALFAKGKKWSDDNLFNGSYYAQKIDLTDRSLLEAFGSDAMGYWNSEAGQIKYQIGQGCEIDQLLPQWHANISGLGELYDNAKLHTALQSMIKNNIKPNMRAHYNTFRIFALNDESGAIICDFPDGAEKPAIPIPYAQESMHGFEYSFAGLLAGEGYIDEAVSVVRGVRDRYNGSNRNPWNEIECGNNYARSMASYALLPIFSGMSFDMTKGEIGFNPIVSRDNFRCLWSLGKAWGNIKITDSSTSLSIAGGRLDLNSITLPYLKNVCNITVDGKAVEYSFADGAITFDGKVSIESELVINCG